MIIGYARVSSVDQNLDRQILELEKYGCEEVFSEKVSGKNFDRPVYKKMKSKLRFGDTLVIHSLSRLGRNKQTIKDEWKYFIEERIDIVVLDMPILDTRKYKELEGVGRLVTDIVFELLSWMVETERDNIRKAQAEGIEIAKEKGKYKGKQYKYSNTSTGKDKIIYDTIVQLINSKESVMEIHRKTGVARNTIYRIIRDLKKKDQDNMT